MQRATIAESVDRRVVVSGRPARELLTVVSYVDERGRVGRGERLVAFFACLYFAALRPSEALALREQDCHPSGNRVGPADAGRQPAPGG
ncbi:hypothetical protein [Micromonospora eburnea]|uniref:hypothetical protein n=1 Tax=Micromonospora eburnea TaxID=227316 RepID=UPI000A878193|nr:hypothetical protein [Micromonospora eburnea]